MLCFIQGIYVVLRFMIFKNRFQELSEQEKKAIDLVVKSFGMYSSKASELITHCLMNSYPKSP